MLGDGAEGVPTGTAGASDDTELPPELRMDDYDDEPGLTVTGSAREEGGGGSGSDSDDNPEAMDEDDEEEVDDEDDEEDGTAGGMGMSLLEEPSTGQVFAYESEGEDSDTEDNIIKPGDHVLLTASTEEVSTCHINQGGLHL